MTDRTEVELDPFDESNSTGKSNAALHVSFHEETKFASSNSNSSASVQSQGLDEPSKEIMPSVISTLDAGVNGTLDGRNTLKLHSKRKELPGSIYHTLRFTDDSREVTKWVSSKERKQHVDDYRCKTYISFTESVGNLTALLLACLYNRPRAIQVLLEAGADVSIKDDLGRSALHCLCASQSERSIYEAFKMIMERVLTRPSADVSDLVNSRESKKGRTPLMEASLMARNNAIILLCKSHLKADLKLRDFEGMTTLHYICSSLADRQAFDCVIEASDVNARDKYSRTPFLMACENNKPDMAKRLLDAGTDLYVEDYDQKNALHYLSASEGENITELLGIISKRVAEKARFSQVLGDLDFPDGPVAIARKFISKTDSHGMTPLQIALKKEHINNAKILIANGADIDIRVDDGRLPLQFACDSKRPYVDLAIVLVKHGADISIKLDEGTALNRYSCSLLHYACRENYVELVDCLLQNGADVTERDTENKRPFYYVQSYSVHKLLSKAGGIDTREREPRLLDESCRKGFSDKAIYLIEHVKDVKPKHLRNAVKYNYQSIAMALIKHPNWYKFLRHTFDGDQNEQTTPFRELIKKMPDVAELVLNRCMVSDPKFKDPGDNNYTVIMNYEFLEDFSLPKQITEEESDEVMRAHAKLRKQFKADDLEFPEFIGHDCSYEALSDVEQKCFSTKWGPVGFRKETHPLSIMVQHGRMNLLSHPLVSSLLHHKWNEFGHYGYYGNFAVYCIFLFFLTAYALVIPSPLVDKCSNETVINEIQESGQCGLNKPRELFLYVAAGAVIIIAILRFSFETTQLITSYSHSFLFFWMYKFILYSLSIIFVFFFFNKPCGCLFFWQWEFGVIATFMAWMNLMFFISKFPLIGIYVIMLSRVFYTFLKVVLLFSLLVIAFGLSFYMAFSEPAIIRSPFSTPGRSLLKMVTMTTGEFEFDDIFRQSPNGASDSEEEVPFQVVSYILWIVFVIVMPVLLTNMLVGLAVGDIDRIQKGAALKKLALQVNLVLAVESVFRRRPFKRILTIAWKKVWPNSKVPCRETFQALKWGKRRLFVEKQWHQFQFFEWGGERYYDLKNITKGLSTTEALSDGDGCSSFERTHSLEAEVEEIHHQLRLTQKQNKELIEAVNESKEDLKRALTLLTERERATSVLGSHGSVLKSAPEVKGAGETQETERPPSPCADPSTPPLVPPPSSDLV